MITRDNIQDLVDNLMEKDKRLIHNTHCEYIQLELCITNNSCFVIITPTDDLGDLEELHSIGNCILSVDDPVFQDLR